jgi:sulfur carrier protein
MEATCEIRLNGELRAVASSSLSDLLSELRLEGRPVAVELNKAVIYREDYSRTKLRPGDSVEIIQFVGGG